MESLRKSVLEKDQQLTPQERALSAEYASHLFYNVQRFGQGRPYLIQSIFQYIHCIRPEWRMCDSLAAEVFTDVMAQSLKFLKKAGALSRDNSARKVLHVDMSDQDLERDVRERIADMQNALNYTGNDVSRTKSYVIPTIAELTIEQDYKFIVEKGGRPRSFYGLPNTLGDPNFSYLCHFAYNGASTGISEFDKMYYDIDIFLKSPDPKYFDRETDSQWALVIEKYNETHPRTPVML